METERFLTRKQVCDRYKISFPTVYKWIKDKKFPQKITFGERCVRWDLNQIKEWEQSRP